MRIALINRSSAVSCLFAVVALLTTVEAFACGENLFRVGRGAVYRAQTAPLPGHLLVVAPNAEARDLAQRLAAAGHDVNIVADSSELAEALRNGTYEVVLAPFADREVIATQSANAGSTASYLPVTLSTEEETIAGGMYAHTVAAREDFGKFLKAIHRTLKDRA